MQTKVVWILNSATLAHKQLSTGNSLFNTYVKNATLKENLKNKNNDWLVTIFSDNASVVKINNKHLFIWKVETHNSPSVLDPYGGAITGVLGNNQDLLDTGIGGAKLLFNTNVLCFGPPDYKKPLLITILGYLFLNLKSTQCI